MGARLRERSDRGRAPTLALGRRVLGRSGAGGRAGRDSACGVPSGQARFRRGARSAPQAVWHCRDALRPGPIRAPRLSSLPPPGRLLSWRPAGEAAAAPAGERPVAECLAGSTETGSFANAALAPGIRSCPPPGDGFPRPWNTPGVRGPRLARVQWIH